MKIAMFSDCYLDLTGGIVSSINAQKSALEARGHTVYIFTTGYPKSPEKQQALAKENVFIVPSCRLFLRGFTPISRRPQIIERWLLRTHPEIKKFNVFYVHYEGGCSIAGLRLARQLKIPSVQVMHGREDAGEENIIPFGFRTIVAAALNWAHSRCLPHPINVSKDDYLANTIAKAKMWSLMVNHANYADEVITPSHHFAQKLNYYGVKKHIHVCPNGYPDIKFPPQAPLKKLNPGETLRIIWHSRLSGEKRIMPFLEALSKVHGKYKLDLYGDGVDLLQAKSFATVHRLKAKFHGKTRFETVQKAILESHLDVLTSYNSDDAPMTLVEAEAAGVPVFLCDPDMKEAIAPGGYVLASGPSTAEMAIALDDLIAHPERIQKMSAAMLKHREEVLISKRIKIVEKVLRNATISSD